MTDVCSANTGWERWVILRIPSIQQDAALASLLQLFMCGQSPQIAQSPSVLSWFLMIWFGHLGFISFIARVSVGDVIHINVQRCICLSQNIMDTLCFRFSDAIICSKEKRLYSFELESLESVSLINARAAAGCASFSSLRNLLREEFYHFKIEPFEVLLHWVN